MTIAERGRAVGLIQAGTSIRQVSFAAVVLNDYERSFTFISLHTLFTVVLWPF